MERLLETFCLQDGVLHNLRHHQERIAWSLGFALTVDLFSEAIMRAAVEAEATMGKWRASVVYTKEGIEEVKLVPYHLPKIEGFRLVEIQENFYEKKWADRSQLEQHKARLPKGVEPLFLLEGNFTDSSFTNLLFEREGQLYTPQVPLLRGTKRALLIQEEKVELCSISLANLVEFEQLHLVNALLNPYDLCFPITAIELLV